MIESISLATLTAKFELDSVRFEAGNECAEVSLNGIHNSIISVRYNGELIQKSSWVRKELEQHPQAKRGVYHFLVPNKDEPGRILRAGLTVHRSTGTWSSLPHKFELTPEPGFEEVFFYLLRPSTGRAIQIKRGMTYEGHGLDLVVPARDRTFSEIPMGHHMLVGEPDTHVSYLWAYLAKKPEWEKV